MTAGGFSVAPRSTWPWPALLAVAVACLTILVAGREFRSARAADASNAIDQLAPGHWLEIPDSKIRAVVPEPKPPGNAGAITGAWNGAALDTKRNRLLVTGGGHLDYAGNEIYAFDFGTLRWSRIWGPTPNDKIPAGRGACDLAYGDGNPSSRHTYDGLEYLPSVDRLLLIGGSRWGCGWSSRDVWLFDLEKLAWSRRADAGIPPALGFKTGFDEASGLFFVNAGDSNHTLWSYDPRTEVWKNVGGQPTVGTYTATIDPRRRLLVTFGAAMHAHSLTSGARRAIQVAGVSDLVAKPMGGVEYDPVGDKIVIWNGGPDVHVLDLDKKELTRRTGAGAAPGAPNGNGTYGRWRYVPSKDVFVLVNAVDENVRVYRPDWRAPTQRRQQNGADATPRAPAAGVTVDARPGVFYAFDPPSFRGPAAGSKHTTWAFHPPSGKVYGIGGDFQDRAIQEPGGEVSAPDSYRQEMYSFDIAARWADGGNRDAGWQRVQPYCGYPGGVQPKSPDYVGWMWDARREGFWMMPGTMVLPGRKVCEDRTVSEKTDERFKYRHIMFYKPDEPDAAKRWTDHDPNAFIPTNTWQSIFDPVKDQIIRFGHHGGSGGIVDIYTIASRRWERVRLGAGRRGGDIRLYQSAVAVDEAKRRAFVVDPWVGVLYRFDLDGHRLTDLGPVPDGRFPNVDPYSYVIWDSVNNVMLVWRNDTAQKLYVYDPGKNAWEQPTFTTEPAGLTPAVTHGIVYVPSQNVTLFLGTVERVGSRVWAFRYK